MARRLALACLAAIALPASVALAQSPNDVKTLEPPGAIKAEGTWSLGARAGDFVFVAGMQGIDPKTNTLVEGPASAHPPGVPQHQADRGLRGGEPQGLR